MREARLGLGGDLDNTVVLYGDRVINPTGLRSRDEFVRHIVATTDTEKGTLHDIARADGYDMLAVPGDVGGRFSVLSPVGLFSGAMCGIDVEAMLAGAAALDK